MTTPHDNTALDLVRALHRNMDWDVWGGRRRVRYWDALEEAIRAACYRGRTLGAWWEAASLAMGASFPGRAEWRAELAGLLDHPDQRAVLKALRTRAGVLVLRLRVESDDRKTAREDNTPSRPEKTRAAQSPATGLFD
jgi:hypothetical protein